MSRDDELDGLVKVVKDWIGNGQVDPSDIGIAARTNEAIDLACKALRAAGIPATIIGREREVSAEPAVGLATMHRMKGLEYRCVAVIDAGNDRLPPAYAIAPEADDPVQHGHDLQRERCLLYVACTRARDLLRVSWSGQPSSFLLSLIEQPGASRGALP